MTQGALHKPKPVAVVALGNPLMGDDGVAVRVMGRVRPLLGEIALLGKKPAVAGRLKARHGETSFSDEPKAWLRAALLQDAEASQAPRPGSLSSIVDWIEGSANEPRLQETLENRNRVVLLDAVCHNASPGHVQHWRIEPHPRNRLHLVRFYQPAADEAFDHLPFWLEEELPEHGTDLIAIEPYRIEEGSELTPVIRSRLTAITGQVGGLLLRILEEEGWNFAGSRTRRRPKKPPRVA